MTKYIFISFAMLLLLFTAQYGPDISVFMKTVNNKINFLNKYPKIRPEKCIKTGKLSGGEKRKALEQYKCD